MTAHDPYRPTIDPDADPPFRPEGLLEAGVIDRCGAERQAIRDRVEECVRGGMKRCEAMEGVAVEYCCSYEKVRNAVYARK